MAYKEKHLDAGVKEENSKKPNLTKAGKRAKLIVRNLPFKHLSESKLKKFFEEYGEIDEVSLLKRNGKLVGCGFVQFTKVQNAAKAIHHANGKEMFGRQIIVDWAIPKSTYLERIKQLKESTEEQEVEVKQKVKSEPSSDDDDDDDDENKQILDYEIDSKPNVSLESDEDSEGEDNDEDEEDVKPNIKEQLKSNDVEEGKTVFVKNIPFSASKSDLRECVSKYGDVEYAVICVDPLTEHSRGTGFVKFKEKESAVSCIKDSNKLLLQDSPLEITLALSKERLEEKKKQKHAPKDSRNLYLIREGVVIAGSKAAEGVSATDMAKRLQIEQWKNQILKNLNMFVSKTRLVIHNLPPKYDDNDLKKLFLKYSNANAVVREARVMRDRKNVGLNGQGVSKEVGFVSFTTHEDALAALRNINNNPNIFTAKKRPIVAFSIENRAILNLKQKRVERSRAKLGVTENKKDKLSKLNSKQRRAIRRKLKIIEKRKEAKKLKPEGKPEMEEKKPVKRKPNGEGSAPVKKKAKQSPEVEKAEFSGVQSEPGKKVKIRSRFNLKTQAAVHKETLKKEKKMKKEKQLMEKGLERVKDAKQKKGKINLNDDKQFSKLISQYKRKIESAGDFKKWYETG